MAMDAQDTRPVRKRLMVYISGFDPRGASFYYPLFAKETAKFAEKTGASVEVSPRSRWKKHWLEWTTRTGTPALAEEVRTLYLVWDDIIRAHWRRTRHGLFKSALRTYTSYVTTGLFRRAWRINKMVFIALLYPVAGFILIHAAWIAVLALAGWFIAHWAGLADPMPLCAGLLGAALGPLAGHRFTRYANGSWLIQTYCFCHDFARAPIPELEQRLDQQAADLADLIRTEKPDEVLICCHSVGTIISIPFLNKFMNLGPWEDRTSLMSLGQIIQLATFMQPQDGRLVTMLHDLATSGNLDWVDFTMPSDGACFALHDPLQSSLDTKVAYPGGKAPKILSARFMEGFSPEEYAKVRRDKYRYHFQYLMTPPGKADFDFPDVVLSRKRLWDRFDHRKTQARDKI